MRTTAERARYVYTLTVAEELGERLHFLEGDTSTIL